MVTEEDPDEWIARMRRMSALRVFGVGLAVVLVIGAWLAVYVNWEGPAPVTRVKVVGGIAVAIGGCLMVAGLVMWVRARRYRSDFPSARLHRD